MVLGFASIKRGVFANQRPLHQFQVDVCNPSFDLHLNFMKPCMKSVFPCFDGEFENGIFQKNTRGGPTIVTLWNLGHQHAVPRGGPAAPPFQTRCDQVVSVFKYISLNG